MKTMRIFFLAFAMVMAMCAVASPDYRFTHITTGEGLPHQQINDIRQDNLGRIWIGTRNGLA